MPYIDVKTTVPLDEAKKLKLKDGLGQIITRIPGKTEAVTMIGLVGDYDLYFNGAHMHDGAYVEVKAYKEVAREYKEAVTDGIFQLLGGVLGISAKNIYVTFYDQKEWGCNGTLL
jgi:phenylpyruvate tautomerase PptA (4-oxalocrotonate tautomerase family)